MPPTVKIEPREPTRELKPLEHWYLECLTRLARHMRRAPTVRELAAKIDRTSTPTYRMLSHLVGLGYVTQDVNGRFHVRPVK